VAPEYKDKTLLNTAGKVMFDELCEVYSFGFVMQYLLTGQTSKPADFALSPAQIETRIDRLAGDWPKEVVTKLSTMASQCTSRQRTNRPSISTAMDSLLKLQADYPPKLTEGQLNTIRQSLAMSAMGKLVAKDVVNCRCGRTSDAGLVCTQNLHFRCNRCFTEHVKKYLGDYVICCHEDGCLAPFTDHHVYDHTDKNVFLDHTEEKMARSKAEHNKIWLNLSLAGLDDKRRHADILDQLDQLQRGQACLMRGQEGLVEAKNGCPSEYVLIRLRSARKIPIKVKNPFSKKRYMLFFLCSKDKTPIKYGIEINRPRDWIIKVAPALKISFLLIRIGLTAASGVQVPFPNWIDSLGMDGLITEEQLESYCEDAPEKFAEMESVVMNSLAAGQSQEELFQLLQQAQTVTAESYREVANLARENPKWRDEMEPAMNRDGLIKWVKKDNVASWHKSP
jgi:hypothetical protein